MGHRVTPSSPLPPSQLTETPFILLLSSPSKPSPSSQFPTQVLTVEKLLTFFLLHQLVSWLPFPTTVNDKVSWEWNVLPVFLRQPRSESSQITYPIPPSICNKRNTIIFSIYTPPPPPPMYTHAILEITLSKSCLHKSMLNPIQKLLGCNKYGLIAFLLWAKYPEYVV